MGKLTLRIDELNVESFETGDERRRSGTVRGHDSGVTEWCTGYPQCLSKQCQTPDNTCHASCGCSGDCDTIEPYC
jgi:hypothetical protein